MPVALPVAVGGESPFVFGQAQRHPQHIGVACEASWTAAAKLPPSLPVT
jgi:hypothetical protein